MAKIPYIWLRGCRTDEEKKKVTDLVTNQMFFNSLFLGILESYDSEIEERGFQEEDYKEAGISELLAFRNGQRSMLRKIARMFNFQTTED